MLLAIRSCRNIPRLIQRLFARVTADDLTEARITPIGTVTIWTSFQATLLFLEAAAPDSPRNEGS
jgi:hypothetical protein